MSEEIENKTPEELKKSLEKEIDPLKEKITKLNEVINNTNNEINIITTRLVEIQGALKELSKL